MTLSIFDEPLVTIDEAAATFRVSAATIRRLIKDGEIPHYRVGTHVVRIPIDSATKALTPTPNVAVAMHKATRADGREMLRRLDSAKEQVAGGKPAFNAALRERIASMPSADAKCYLASLLKRNDPRIRTMRLTGLIRSIKGVGATKAAWMFAAVGVPRQVWVKSLTAKQRRQFAEVLLVAAADKRSGLSEEWKAYFADVDRGVELVQPLHT